MIFLFPGTWAYNREGFTVNNFVMCMVRVVMELGSYWLIFLYMVTSQLL